MVAPTWLSMNWVQGRHALPVRCALTACEVRLELVSQAAGRLAGHWSEWKASAPEDVLVPERDWEGADLPVRPSRVGGSYERLNELRDSGIYRENGRTYLLYGIAGSQGIALAEIEGPD